MDRASSVATFVLCCESLNLGIFITYFLKRKRSKRLPNGPNSVTVMGTRALFVDRLHLLFHSLRALHWILCPYVFSCNISSSPHPVSAFHFSFLAAFDLVLEEAFEEMT